MSGFFLFFFFFFFFFFFGIIGHDETPQFINYGVDGTPKGIVFCGRSEACQKMIRENRECATIHPFATFAGDILMCHVIFASQGITSRH